MQSAPHNSRKHTHWHVVPIFMNAGNPPEACDKARDKRATREVMSQAGLPNPKSAMIYTDDDIEKAAAAVGFPAVIKPITAAASMGVVRVDNLEVGGATGGKYVGELPGGGGGGHQSLRLDAMAARRPSCGPFNHHPVSCGATLFSKKLSSAVV
jgi:hypothetical protein